MTTKTLTPKKALAEREDLERRIGWLKEKRDKIAVRLHEIAAETKETHRKLAGDRAAAFQAGREPETRELQTRLVNLEAEQLQLERDVTDARNAERALRSEIKSLHYLHFEPFAENAEKLGQAALKALEKLENEYLAAEAAWQAAAQEWNRITRDSNDRRGSALGTLVEDADGSMRATTENDVPPRLSLVPGCPLTPAGEVFTGRPPRPAEIEVEDVEADLATVKGGE